MKTRVVDVAYAIMGQPTIRFNLECADTARFDHGASFEIVSRATSQIVKGNVIALVNRSNGTTSVRLVADGYTAQHYNAALKALRSMPEVTNLRTIKE